MIDRRQGRRDTDARERQGWGLIASSWLHFLILLSFTQCPADVIFEPPDPQIHITMVDLLQPVPGDDPGDVGPDGSSPSPLAAQLPQPELPEQALASARSVLSEGEQLPDAPATGDSERPVVEDRDPPNTQQTSDDPFAEPAAGKEEPSDATDQGVPDGVETRDEVEQDVVQPSSDALADAPTPSEEAAPFEEPEEVTAERETEDTVAVAAEEDLLADLGTDDGHWIEFVRNDAGADTVGIESARISNTTSKANIETRAAVTADHEGPVTKRAQSALAAAASSPTLQLDAGDPADPMGSRPEVSDAVAAAGAEAGGGGRRGQSTGRGAEGIAGTRRAGGSAARAGGGAGSAAQRSATTGGPATQDGFAPAPDGVRQAASDGPSWWQPVAVRIAVTSAPQTRVRHQSVVPSPTDGIDEALLERPETAVDVGGTQLDQDQEAQVSDVDVEQLGEGTGDREGAQDPVADLRDALGWGGIDRSELAPRRQNQGDADGEGAAATSPQAVLDDKYLLADEVMINAQGTELGKYLARTDDIVRDNWYQLDLDSHARASGVQGTAVVYYRVAPNGKAYDAHVVRSSGHPMLDRMALDAVPERFPRRPRRVEWQGDLHRKVTFVYDNPIVPGAVGP